MPQPLDEDSIVKYANSRLIFGELRVGDVT